MMKNDDFKLLRGFADERTDICDCRAAFATENIKYVFFFQKIDICTNNSTLFYISETL